MLYVDFLILRRRNRTILVASSRTCSTGEFYDKIYVRKPTHHRKTVSNEAAWLMKRFAHKKFSLPHKFSLPRQTCLVFCEKDSR